MKTKTGLHLISALFLSQNLIGQSFIVKRNGDMIECAKIITRKKVVILNNENSNKILKIDKDSLTGYYQDNENAFYKNLNGFKEEIVSGEIKIHRGEIIQYNPGSAFGNMPAQYTKWYLEKNDSIIEAFNQMHGTNFFIDLDKEKIQKLIDEPVSKKAFNELKKKGKLEDLLGLFQSYNARKASSQKGKMELKQNIESESTITFIRDFGGESKENLEFTINSEKYSLERNSKVEISIPNDFESIIDITNSINNASGVIISSRYFPKYYQLKLNKKNKGVITKINGNSSYYKTRMDYYEKRAKK